MEPDIIEVIQNPAKLYLDLIKNAGRIWAKNNTDGRGATFIFTTPIIDVDSNLAGEHHKDK